MSRSVALLILGVLKIITVFSQSEFITNDRFKRQTEKTIGKICEHSTDCGKGSYCGSNKLCACLSSFVDIEGYCWPKVNPGEAGCTNSRQCEATWPGASCINGECRCANNQPAFHTKDGTICLNYGFCPLGDENQKYKTDDGTMECPHGIDEICPNGFDCICNTPNCEDGTSAGTFCCPSRALTCTMGMDQGETLTSGGSTIKKFYYNTVTGECEPFAFRGSKGNANNFVTKEHCESYCKQTCPRGQPEYNEAVYPQVKKSVKFCNAPGSSCSGNHNCQTVGTTDYCCPKPEYICSRTGGMQYDVPPISGFDVGISSDPKSTVSFSRFYYDETQKRCLPFRYLGQAGNYNNFLSEAHCDQFCAKLVCDVGEPLKDNTGMRNIKCSSSDECPATHKCSNHVCCPTKQTVCKLPQAIGSCGKYADKWWFNAETGNCIQFTYSGCQGNANNFETFAKCSKFCRDATVQPKCVQGTALRNSFGDFIVCDGTAGDVQKCPINYYCYFDGKTYGCCPTRSQTCQLKPDPGTKCGPTVLRWYYDTTKRACTTFDFNGCDGNSNNFAMQQDCNDYCRVESCPDGGDPWKNGNGISRVCKSTSDCPNTHYCTPVSKRTNRGVQDTNHCCPKKDYVCSRYQDSGVRCSSSTIKRYWFNFVTKTCETFTYNGCDGNNNNFSSKKACENYCMSSACRPGAIAYQDPDSGVLATCNLGTSYSGGCPSGFRCEKSELLGQPVCCGGKKEYKALCPSVSRPFIDAQSHQAMQCTPNVDASCPGGYFCWYSTTEDAMSGYYCCLKSDSEARKRQPELMAEKDDGVCPPKLHPIRAQNGIYKTCSPTAPVTDTVNSCGHGVTCQWSEKESLYICCSIVKSKTTSAIQAVLKEPYLPVVLQGTTTQTPPICPPIPPNLKPVMENSVFKTCSPQAIAENQGGCPDQAYCLYTDTLQKYICCTGQSNSNHQSQRVNIVVPTNVHPAPRPPIGQPRGSVQQPAQPLHPVPKQSAIVPPYIPVPPPPKVVQVNPINRLPPMQHAINPNLHELKVLKIQVEPPKVSSASNSHSSQPFSGGSSGVSQTSSPECSKAPGFLPIKTTEGEFHFCSPMEASACRKFENPNLTISRCLFSSVQSRYLCCQSLTLNK